MSMGDVDMGLGFPSTLQDLFQNIHSLLMRANFLCTFFHLFLFKYFIFEGMLFWGLLPFPQALRNVIKEC